MKNVIIFDLDETVIDSRHRTPNNPDGTLNLAAYRERHTAENVAKDTLLALASVIRQAYRSGSYVIILTARIMAEYDYRFLTENGIPYHKIMSRDRCSEKHAAKKDGEYKRDYIIPFLNLQQFAGKYVVMFDDSSAVKTALRKYFPVICAHKANRKLQNVAR